MSERFPSPRRRVVRRVLGAAASLTLAATSTGCFLWGFAAARSNEEKLQKQLDENLATCKADIAKLHDVPPEPPTATLDGNWQCLYTGPDGSQISESIDFASDGRHVSFTGRNNVNENVVGDGEVGGGAVWYEVSGGNPNASRLELTSNGRMLDGSVVYWYAGGGTCYSTQYRCRRRW